MSSGHELEAANAFEAILKSSDPGFQAMASKRLDEIYLQFGMWDKVNNSEGQKEEYDKFHAAISQHLSHDESVPRALLEDYQGSAPLSLEARILANDALFRDLAESLDINIAQNIIENYKIVFSKHKKHLNVQDRLNIHYTIAVLQMFALATPPTHVMSCLALDMDYKPCRELSKLSSRVTKVAPPFTSMTHADQFMSLSQFDWPKLLEFYQASPKGVKLGGITSAKNNLELLTLVQDKCLNELLVQRPLSTLKKSWKLKKTNSAFTILQNQILCEAYDETSKSKLAEPHCHAALVEKLPSDTVGILENFVSSFNNPENAKEALNSLWQDAPSLAVHIIKKCVTSLNARGKSSKNDNTAQIWFLLEAFAREHKWGEALNGTIAKLNKSINNASAKKRQQQQQQQRQQQQQQQQHFFRQQQQRSQPPPNDMSKKNYYKVLGVPQQATGKDIRKSYLSMTRKYHPDKQGQLSEAQKIKNQEKMSEINEAYEILSDEGKRKEYDDQRSGRAPQGQGSPFGQGGFPFGSGNFKMNFGGFH